MTRLRFALLCLLLAVGLGWLYLDATRADESPTRARRHILLDFTDGEPTSWREMPNFVKDEIVYRWRAGEDQEPWTVRDATVEAEGATLVIQPTATDRFCRLWRDVEPFDAAQANLLKIVTTVEKSSFMRFFWSAPGELFKPESVLLKKVEAKEGISASRETHVFDLQHTQFSGRIGRIRFDPSQNHLGVTRLHSLSLEYRHFDEELLETQAGRPAVQDFVGDARIALPALPGRAIRRTLSTVPPGSLLRFALGLQQRIGDEVTFHVHAQQGDGPPIPIFERTLKPSSDGERWHSFEVDLAPFAGAGLDLELSVDGTDLSRLIAGIPVWGHPRVSAPVHEALPPNVLFVVADTLRADRTSLHGYAKPTTPNLDVWAARDAMVFDNLIAAAPWTLPAHMSMLSGLEPFHHVGNHGAGAWSDLTLLPEILRRHGYATTAVTGGAYLVPSFGLGQGFQRLTYRRNGEADLELSLPQALDFLESDPAEPFLLFFHTYETHGPYVARQPWLGLLSPEQEDTPWLRTQPTPPDPDQGWRYDAQLHAGKGQDPPLADDDERAALSDIYDSSIAYMDSAVGRLIRRVQDLGLENDTVIVFTSDHGESLGEDGRYGHYSLYDEQLRIPLAISVPGRAAEGRHIDRQVRQIDLTPTLLDALGLPPARYADGRSLMPFWGDEPVEDFPETALSYASSSNHGVSLRVANRRKAMLETAPWPSLQPRAKVFDLETDPDETAPLTIQEPSADADLVAGLGRRYASRCHWRLWAQNTTSSPLQVWFKGAINQYALEEPDPECADCLDIADRQLKLDLPAGKRYTAMLPARSDGGTRLALHLGDGSLETHLPTDTFDGPNFGWIWQDGAWQEASSARTDGETGLWLTRHIDACPWMRGAQGAAAPDDETSRQLKALGYLP